MDTSVRAGEMAEGNTLANLVGRAIREFGATCFWNVRTDLPLCEMAEVAIAKLRKYGGMDGFRLADEIAQELAHIEISHGPH